MIDKDKSNEDWQLPYDFEKSITFSIDALKKLNKERTYISQCDGRLPFDNTTICTSCKSKGDNFIIKFFINDIYDESLMRYVENFTLNKDIRIENDDNFFYINKNSTTNISITIKRPKVVTLNVDNFQDSEDENFDNQRLRLVIPVNKEPKFDEFNCRSSKISGVTRISGLIEVKVHGNEYHIFKHTNNDTKENYLFVESIKDNSFAEFKKNTSAILLAYGFVTGNFYQDEYYYQIIEKDFEAFVIGTAYSKRESSIITNSKLFNSIGFNNYLEYNGKNMVDREKLFLKPEVFSKICDLLNEIPALSRSVKLILEGNNSDILMLRAGIFSIVLETITGFICEVNKDRLKPIKDKEISKLILKDFKSILNQYQSSISSGYGMKILNAKLDNINSPTNSQKLSKPFDLLGIQLTDSERKILEHRNKFLHGTSPFDELDENEKDLAYVTKKLFMLCSSLILGYSGYKGHIVDYGGYHLLKWEKKITNEFFKII